MISIKEFFSGGSARNSRERADSGSPETSDGGGKKILMKHISFVKSNKSSAASSKVNSPKASPPPQ